MAVTPDVGGHDLTVASDFRACIAVDYGVSLDDDGGVAVNKDLPIRHFPCAHVTFHDQRNEIFAAPRRLRAAHKEELLVENIE